MSDPGQTTPPRIPRRLLAGIAGRGRAESILGDLDEEFSSFQLSRRGARAARRWYWWQALRSIPPLLIARMSPSMLRSPGERSPRTRQTRTTDAHGLHPQGDPIPVQLLHDVRHTLRTLAKNPAFAGVVILTLALGIGANTVVFSAVDGLVLHPFPFPDGSRLVAVGTQYPRLGQTDVTFIEHMSPAEYVDIRNESRSLERVVAWDLGNRQVAFGDVAENVFTGFWWGNAFETLGVEPFLGRGMTWEETVRGDAVAVLSYRLWTSAFGADSSLVGRSIVMNGNPYEVVGIAPPGALISGTDLWIPEGGDPALFGRDRRAFQILARIAPGYSLREVNTELETLARRTERAYGAEFEEYGGWRLEAATWTDANVRTFRPAALILLGAVAFVLLLVCTNVASLLLARSATRRREMALRRALGAGRARLLRQVLTESVTMALLGGAIGVGIAVLGVDVLSNVAAQFPFLSGGIAINGRVLLFTAGVSVLTGVAFGTVPALQGTRDGIHGDLKSESAGSGTHGSRLRVQRFFVAVEVALALMLLVGGGLFVRSVLRMNRVDPGYDPQQLLTMRMTLPREEYPGRATVAFFDELEERLLALPGVERVGIGSQFPPIAFAYGRVATEGREILDEGQLPTAMTTFVSPGYFEALGIPLLRGRTFDEGDVEGTPLVGVLNEAASDLLFPNRNALGERIFVQGDPVEVVGIVGNALNQGIDAPTYPEVFASHRQMPGFYNQFFLLVRASVAPMSLLPAIRAEIREMDADQPVYRIQMADAVLAQPTAARRIAANVLTLFAAFALLLAAVGIFSVVSFGVADRTREIGLRVALGAEGDQVRWLMVRQALTPVLAGAVVGMVGALATGRAIQGLLFEVSGTDPGTLGGVSAVLLATAALASWMPANRASRLDPVEALREE